MRGDSADYRTRGDSGVGDGRAGDACAISVPSSDNNEAGMHPVVWRIPETRPWGVGDGGAGSGSVGDPLQAILALVAILAMAILALVAILALAMGWRWIHPVPGGDNNEARACGVRDLEVLTRFWRQATRASDPNQAAVRSPLVSIRWRSRIPLGRSGIGIPSGGDQTAIGWRFPLVAFFRAECTDVQADRCRDRFRPRHADVDKQIQSDGDPDSVRPRQTDSDAARFGQDSDSDAVRFREDSDSDPVSDAVRFRCSQIQGPSSECRPVTISISRSMILLSSEDPSQPRRSMLGGPVLDSFTRSEGGRRDDDQLPLVGDPAGERPSRQEVI
jgi:hypothetical protein